MANCSAFETKTDEDEIGYYQSLWRITATSSDGYKLYDTELRTPYNDEPMAFEVGQAIAIALVSWSTELIKDIKEK